MSEPLMDPKLIRIMKSEINQRIANARVGYRSTDGKAREMLTAATLRWVLMQARVPCCEGYTLEDMEA